MFDILNDNKNKQIILDALKWQGFYGDFVVNKLIKKEELQEQDLKTLRNLGLDVKIVKGE